mmetsp:Transcript_13706/g.43938  ORF Transcript_13706/g.43938 Transcript_13706/m.43938 type:complete len:312 (-) Transcript_13706:22-957(-)
MDVLQPAQQLQEDGAARRERRVAAGLVEPRAHGALAQLHLDEEHLPRRRAEAARHGHRGTAGGDGVVRRVARVRVLALVGRVCKLLDELCLAHHLLPHLVVPHDVHVVEPRQASRLAHRTILRALRAGEQHLLHRILHAVQPVRRAVHTPKPALAEARALDKLGGETGRWRRRRRRAERARGGGGRRPREPVGRCACLLPPAPHRAAARTAQARCRCWQSQPSRRVRGQARRRGVVGRLPDDARSARAGGVAVRSGRLTIHVRHAPFAHCAAGARGCFPGWRFTLRLSDGRASLPLHSAPQRGHTQKVDIS